MATIRSMPAAVGALQAATRRRRSISVTCNTAPATQPSTVAVPAPATPSVGTGPAPKTSRKVRPTCIGAVRNVTRKAIAGRPAPIQAALIGTVSASRAMLGAPARR